MRGAWRWYLPFAGRCCWPLRCRYRGRRWVLSFRCRSRLRRSGLSVHVNRASARGAPTLRPRPRAPLSKRAAPWPCAAPSAPQSAAAPSTRRTSCGGGRERGRGRRLVSGRARVMRAPVRSRRARACVLLALATTCAHARRPARRPARSRPPPCARAHSLLDNNAREEAVALEADVRRAPLRLLRAALLDARGREVKAVRAGARARGRGVVSALRCAGILAENSAGSRRSGGRRGGPRPLLSLALRKPRRVRPPPRPPPPPAARARANALTSCRAGASRRSAAAAG